MLRDRPKVIRGVFVRSFVRSIDCRSRGLVNAFNWGSEDVESMETELGV